MSLLLFVYSICLAFIWGFFPHLYYQHFSAFTFFPSNKLPRHMKIPREAEINAAIIYKQSLQMHKGGSVIAEDHHPLE